MQYLEVSCAVRRIYEYKSLGFKGLITSRSYRMSNNNLLGNTVSTNFHSSSAFFDSLFFPYCYLPTLFHMYSFPPISSLCPSFFLFTLQIMTMLANKIDCYICLTQYPSTYFEVQPS